MTTSTEAPAAAVESVELAIDPRSFNVTHREALGAILADCLDCAQDDVFWAVDELPSAGVTDRMRSRRDDYRRFRNIGREFEHGRANIPTGLLDEIERVAGYHAEKLGNKVTSIGGMSWDDCQHFDSEGLANEIYATHEILTALKRLQFELENNLIAMVD